MTLPCGCVQRRVQLLVFQGRATMFTPPSLTIALLMMITSAICWGSWANTYKGVKNYRFELFYWDYAIGIFLISLILAFTHGEHRPRLQQFHEQCSGRRYIQHRLRLWWAEPSSIWRICCSWQPSTWPDWPSHFRFRSESRSWWAVVLNYILQPKGNVLFLAVGVAVRADRRDSRRQSLRQSPRVPAARFRERASSSAWSPEC